MDDCDAYPCYKLLEIERALLLERVIEQACGDTWRNIRAALAQIKLAQLLSPHGEVWQVTEPSSEAVNHLKCLELKNPPAILHLS